MAINLLRNNLLDAILNARTMGELHHLDYFFESKIQALRSHQVTNYKTEVNEELCSMYEYAAFTKDRKKILQATLDLAEKCLQKALEEAASTQKSA